MLPAESEHTAAQALLALQATRLARQQWRSGMAPSALDGSWAGVRPRVEAITRSAMVGSARNAGRLVPAQLVQMGTGVKSAVTLIPETFGTQTMLGADVGHALESSKIRAKQAIGSGSSPAQALDIGEEWLDDLIRSVMADADRAAQQALITATPRMGWVRIVNPPCCARCAVLSGRWYRHSAGFDRHPRCDCYHRPAPQDLKGTKDVPSPDDLAASGGIHGLNRAQEHAIADGADASQVLNAYRVKTSRDGRSSPSVKGMTTTEGATKRGLFGRANRGQQRLTPTAIYKKAGEDRDEAVRLLKVYGYIT